VAHWAIRSASFVRAAFLVAVPDPDGPNFPSAAQGFKPVPLKRLPFPSLVVASTNDPFGSVTHARLCASAWGGEFIEVASAGHINAASGHGEWPAGFTLLGQLLRIPG
jgi:serine hydrolase